MTDGEFVEKLRLPVPVGVAVISARGGKIAEILLLPAENPLLGGDGQEISYYNATVLKLAALQIQEYFSAERMKFSLPLEPQGKTEFSRRIYAGLENIPFGALRTYGELAAAAGQPHAARAVGQAMARNRFSLVLPCHRVIGCHGKMTGFSGGKGISTKEWLLAFENKVLAKSAFAQ